MKRHTKTECFKLMKCDYYQKKGHLKENCYKLNGFPPYFKPKKRANNVTWNQHGTDVYGQQHMPSNQQTFTFGHHQVANTHQFAPIPPVSTQDQYNQILRMLSKSNITELSAHMAGEGNVTCQSDNTIFKQIIDTSVTNHMIGDEGLLQSSVPTNDTGKVQLHT